MDYHTTKNPNCKLNVQDYISFLQRYIIVHSYIYYELDDNIISDEKYDRKARELVYYKSIYPEEWANSEYRDNFGDDYIGITGFTLYHSLTPKQKQIIKIICNTLPVHKNGRIKKYA